MGVGLRSSDRQDTDIPSSKMRAKIKEGAYFIVNKHYPYARLAQWGEDKRECGTYEIEVFPDQLWKIEESEKVSNGYHIKNLHHPNFRLTKFKKGDKDVGVYNGQYHADQVWTFKKEGEYYRIINHYWKGHKLAKFGKDDDEWGTYSGNDYDDQLWKLVPRYKLHAEERMIFAQTNSRSTPMTFDFSYTQGVQKTKSGSFSETKEIENSVNVAVTASYEAGDAGGASGSVTMEYGHRVMNAVTQVSSWENTETTQIQTKTKDLEIAPGETV